MARPRPLGVINPPDTLHCCFNAEMSHNTHEAVADSAHDDAREPISVAKNSPIEKPLRQTMLELNRLIFLRPRDPKLFARRGEAFFQLRDLLSASVSTVHESVGKLS